MEKSDNRPERIYTVSLIKVTVKTLCCLSLIGFLCSYAVAVPPPPPPPLVVAPPPPGLVIPPPPQPYRRGLRPPPRGKAWVEIMGNWTLVIAPPGDGPYIWVDDSWVPDPTPPPPGAEWVPGHWGRHGWVLGHWRAVAPAPAPGLSWAPGHWQGNVWIPGHWEGTPPPGRIWVRGHWGPHGHWISGRWK